jgi:hypothetical protein
MSNTERRSDLGIETIPATEAADIALIVERNLALLDTTARPVRRGQHPKGHGCVRAEFIIENGLPPTLAHGVFREPRAFPALIRFSNGAGEDDRKADAHGMAIKLLEVDGQKLYEDDPRGRTQDFILVDNARFFIRNAREYARFSDAFVRSHGSSKVLLLVGLLFRYFWRHLGELRILIKFASRTPANPLLERYWSTTPYRLGGTAVKYSARSAAGDANGPVATPNGLREAMATQLAAGEATFDFMIQKQVDPRSTPVEDPTVEWEEQIAPFTKVATIRIPSQSFTSAQQMEACERLSFNVWRCLPDHRPLGAINRIRRSVYEALSKRRHELDGETLEEPTREWVERLWPFGAEATGEAR